MSDLHVADLVQVRVEGLWPPKVIRVAVGRGVVVGAARSCQVRVPAAVCPEPVRLVSADAVEPVVHLSPSTLAPSPGAAMGSPYRSGAADGRVALRPGSTVRVTSGELVFLVSRARRDPIRWRALWACIAGWYRWWVPAALAWLLCSTSIASAARGAPACFCLPSSPAPPPLVHLRGIPVHGVLRAVVELPESLRETDGRAAGLSSSGAMHGDAAMIDRVRATTGKGRRDEL